MSADAGLHNIAHQVRDLLKCGADPSKDQIPGTGLDLYITRKIVEAMGGNITLLRSEGQGTSVTFTPSSTI